MLSFKKFISVALPVAQAVAPVVGIFNRRAGIVATALVAAGMAYAHDPEPPVGSTHDYTAESAPLVKVDLSRLEPDVIGERVYSGNGDLLGTIDREGVFTHNLTNAK